ncbi:MAG: hypothetical protein HUU49_02535 [Candidatus Buchananbacteria bacterium]|nr:hypothetical protein [Candidatus Buchananbacteria bacterium]
MNFVLFNIALVLVGAAIAGLEGRLSHRQLGSKSIPWLAHGGMWADLVLISTMAYFIGPQLSDVSPRMFVFAGVVGILASIVMHLAYVQWADLSGHIVEPSNQGLNKLTAGGWYHLAYMALVITAIVAYYAGTSANKFWVSLLLVAFIIPAVWQPGWYAHKLHHGYGRIDANGWGQAAVMVILISISFWYFTPYDFKVEVVGTSEPTIQLTATKLPWQATPFDEQGQAIIQSYTVVRFFQKNEVWQTTGDHLSANVIAYHLIGKDDNSLLPLTTTIHIDKVGGGEMQNLDIKLP